MHRVGLLIKTLNRSILSLNSKHRSIINTTRMSVLKFLKKFTDICYIAKIFLIKSTYDTTATSDKIALLHCLLLLMF